MKIATVKLKSCYTLLSIKGQTAQYSLIVIINSVINLQSDKKTLFSLSVEFKSVFEISYMMLFFLESCCEASTVKR